MSNAAQTPAASGPSAKARPLGLTGLIRNPGLYFLTLFRGRFVGRDEAGNQYFERPGKQRARRWVVYAGVQDPSVVPPEWHAWLHHLTDAPLAAPRRAWQRPHLPNLTASALPPRPIMNPGHRIRPDGPARS